MSKTVTVSAYDFPRNQQSFLRRVASTAVSGAAGLGTGMATFSAVSRMMTPAAGLVTAGLSATVAAPLAAGVAAGAVALVATQWVLESASGHDQFVKADDIRPTDSATAQPADGASNEAAKTH